MEVGGDDQVHSGLATKGPRPYNRKRPEYVTRPTLLPDDISSSNARGCPSCLQDEGTRYLPTTYCVPGTVPGSAGDTKPGTCH